MSRLWIKICGITQKQDAVAAAQLGADAIGLVFYKPSPRSVTLSQASKIFTGILPSLKIVGLFVNPEPSEVTEVVESGLVDYLQFHGDESEEFCQRFNMPYLKAFKVGADRDIASDISNYNSADFILLDSFDKDAPGGTGKTFDWSTAEATNASSSTNLIMAGGLNSSNVRKAVNQVRPFGVDVSSGVERKPGIKDMEKMQVFIEEARGTGSVQN